MFYVIFWFKPKDLHYFAFLVFFIFSAARIARSAMFTSTTSLTSRNRVFQNSHLSVHNPALPEYRCPGFVERASSSVTSSLIAWYNASPPWRIHSAATVTSQFMIGLARVGCSRAALSSQMAKLVHWVSLVLRRRAAKEFRLSQCWVDDSSGTSPL